MPRRKYRSDPEELLAQGRQIVRRDGEARFQHRVEMVNLVLAGAVPSELARLSGDSKNAITMWVKTADERGFEALRDKVQPGRPSRLSSAQTAEVRAVVAEDDPEAHGFVAWDGQSLSSFVKERYGVDLGVRQCQRMLRAMGPSSARPQ